MSNSVPCPICKKAVPREADTYPFCTARCRLIDLGNWLGGKYAIPGESTDESADDKSKPDDD